MQMFLCDSFYNFENSDVYTMASKNRVVNNPKYIPNIGEKVFLGYSLASVVKDVCYDYEHNIIVVQF